MRKISQKNYPSQLLQKGPVSDISPINEDPLVDWSYLFSYIYMVGGLNKREHIIKTGQDLIWSKGYAGCSIKDITTASGLPKGSFYHYFESKEKFALEAMADYVTRFEEVLPDQNNDLKTLEKLIDLRIRSVTKLKYTRECYLSMMCHAYIDQEDSFRKKIVQTIERSNECITELLAILIDKKLIKNFFKCYGTK